MAVSSPRESGCSLWVPVPVPASLARCLSPLAASRRQRQELTLSLSALCFFFPRPLPPLTGHSVIYALTLNSPGPSPQTPLVPNRVNVLKSADGLSFALHLATYVLGPIPFLFNQLCPPPHSDFSPIIITITPHGLFRSFRSFNAKYAPYTLFNPITPQNK